MTNLTATNPMAELTNEQHAELYQIYKTLCKTGVDITEALQKAKEIYFMSDDKV